MKKTLKECYPEIAKQWDYEKNYPKKPNEFLPGSGKKVWWKCNQGHEWCTTIHSRNRGSGCPYCSGRKK